MLIYAALNPVTNELIRSVEKFNEAHTDAKIEIRDYSDEGGRERLQTELVLGRVPDIMDLHYFGRDGQDLTYDDPVSSVPPADEYWMPYRQLIQKGYLEKRQSSSDRREYHLRPTEKYMRRFNVSSSYLQSVLDRVKCRFSPEDARQLDRMLRIVGQELMPEVELR